MGRAGCSFVSPLPQLLRVPGKGEKADLLPGKEHIKHLEKQLQALGSLC